MWDGASPVPLSTAATQGDTIRTGLWPGPCRAHLTCRGAHMIYTPHAFALPLRSPSLRTLTLLALLSMLLSACASGSQQATHAASSSTLSPTASSHSAATSPPMSTAAPTPAPYTFPLLPPGAPLP